METENWENNEFESAPQDAEYQLTLTKAEISFIAGCIDVYSKHIAVLPDDIVNDTEVFEKLTTELELMLSIGATLTDAAQIKYKTDIIGELYDELDILKEANNKEVDIGL